MNYLKKYRKDAGLSSNNENVQRFGGELTTPTKETLDFLAGTFKQSKAPAQAMKTPVRRYPSPPAKVTPSERKEASRKSVGHR